MSTKHSSSGLEVRGITVDFGRLRILDDVSLHVKPGQIVGLIGPNGAGKTTVFNVISGFVTPTSGSVVWRGKDKLMKPHQLAGLGIARTLQGVGLFDSLTVLDNLVVGATHRSRTGLLSAFTSAPRADREENARREQARGLLADLGILDTADRVPADLPYPIRKRVALARALMGEPELIMLDEPAGGLAQEDIASLALLIRTWVPQKSVLLVEHHMDFVMGICESIFVLDAGKIIAAGTPEVIQKDVRVRAAYLGEDAA